MRIQQPRTNRFVTPSIQSRNKNVELEESDDNVRIQQPRTNRFTTPSIQSRNENVESEESNDKSDDLNDDNECKICMDNKKNTYIGCSHLLCIRCAKNSRIRECPFCRHKIKQSEIKKLCL